MAILTSYSLVPELQHYFNKFVINSEVNRDNVPPPTDINEQYMPPNSFINMLFDDTYSQPDYEYRYVDETNVFCIPRSALARIQIYPGSWKYLSLDASGDNIFNLQNEDFAALNALLAYRNGATDSTSLLLIDSTAVSFVYDSTASVYILYGSFNSFTKVLPKLIYLYLRLQLLNDFSLYNNNIVLSLSSCGLIETCFEAYLLDKYFSYITNMDPNLIYNCNCNGDQD